MLRRVRYATSYEGMECHCLQINGLTFELYMSHSVQNQMVVMPWQTNIQPNHDRPGITRTNAIMLMIDAKLEGTAVPPTSRAQSKHCRTILYLNNFAAFLGTCLRIFG